MADEAGKVQRYGPAPVQRGDTVGAVGVADDNGRFVTYADYAALLHRAEAAERERDRLREDVRMASEAIDEEQAIAVRMQNERDTAREELSRLRRVVGEAPTLTCYVEKFADETVVWLPDEAMPSEYANQKVAIVPLSALESDKR